MKFYLGVSNAAWLRRYDVPMFMSRRELMRCRRLPIAAGSWALDSGGFTEVAQYGGWRTTPGQYVDQVRRLAAIGGLAWSAPQDWMVEPAMIDRTGLTVLEHQLRTVANLVELRRMAPDLVFIPVLQGWTGRDYIEHVRMYGEAGVDLRLEPLVGLGSVCRRQASGEIEDIVLSLVGLGLALHGFGCKVAAIEKVGYLLESADSMAWSYRGRRTPRLPGHTHVAVNEAHCPTFAFSWRDRVLAGLEAQQQHLVAL